MKYMNTFPYWGPYGKKYMGISRIAQHSFANGVRFDFTTAPAVFAGDIKLPNTTIPSGCHPWLCAEDYSFFTYRYDIIGKQEVYSEVSYVKLDDESVLVRTEISNNSPLIQNCLINYFCSVEYPEPQFCSLNLPLKSEFKKAVDYDSYTYAVKRPWDSQNADGLKKGTFADSSFTQGFGLGDRADKWHMPHRIFKPFGGEKGDALTLHIDVEHDYQNAVLAIRYKTTDIDYSNNTVKLINGKSTAEFLLNGSLVSFLPCDEPQITFVALGELSKGRYDISMSSLGAGAMELDFFCICEDKDKHHISTKTKQYKFKPLISTHKCDSGYLSSYKYEDVDGEYFLRTFSDNTRCREIETGALEDCMSARLSNSDPTFDDVAKSFTSSFSRKHSDDGFFHNTIVHTIFIEPGSEHIEYAVISKGVTEYKTKSEYEKIYADSLKGVKKITLLGEGKKYELSVNILKATVLTNVVYPIYKHGEFIVHHTPGKRWDCLYTWDSGFIGLGMNDDYSAEFADYILNTYLSDSSNPDYAFLHHGSPVPVQMFLWLEMLKKADDKASLLALYPKLRHYYDFLAGKIRGSTTAKFKSGLTTTYDYFYSSSGMDDYPAQVAMMSRNIRDICAPVISTSQLIRCAKILRCVASRLDEYNDIKAYDDDIARLTNALNAHSWDKESGYFGYVLHDDNYEPMGEIMRTDSGENLNKGLDGIYPLIAGACNDEQKDAILAHLKNPNELLCPYGISAVDMSAEYFMVNGYWNGNVWFPHQWFIWKSMLDIGETDFAYKIASLALDIWKREVDYSYYTFEMVSVVTGRGGWFHNFGGLSTPITMWANAYYKKGTFNTGFDLWVESCEFSDDYRNMKAAVKYFGQSKKITAIAVMNESSDYEITLDGKKINAKKRFDSTIELELELKANSEHIICISAKA